MHAILFYFQQLRIRLLSVVLWCVVWGALLCFFAVVFNSLSERAADAMIAFQQLPKEVFEAVNIDPTSYLSNVESFLSGQFLFIYLLGGSLFAYSLGSNAIGKRIEDRTIAGWLTRKLSRGAIYLSQFLVVVTLLVLIGVALATFGQYAFSVILTSGSLSADYFQSLFLGSTILFVAFAALGQLVGTLMNGGKSFIIGSVFVTISWYLSNLGEIANLPEWSQRLSLFYYLDVDQLRSAFSLNSEYMAWLGGISLALWLIGYVVFRYKDIQA